MNPTAKIYLGNLSPLTTEDDLRKLLIQAGTVASIDLIRDRISGQSKGYAYVEMSNQAEAQKAVILFNGYTLDDGELRVKLVQPRGELGGLTDRASSRLRRSPEHMRNNGH